MVVAARDLTERLTKIVTEHEYSFITIEKKWLFDHQEVLACDEVPFP